MSSPTYLKQQEAEAVRQLRRAEYQLTIARVAEAIWRRSTKGLT